MSTQFKAILSKVLTIGAIFAFLFGVATPALAQSSAGVYPLAGATYPAQNLSGTRLPAYDPTWTPDGRNFQPNLPSGPQRVPFSVSIEIVSGTYVGNAVACDMYLDNARNGKGSMNKQVVNHENGKQFTVVAAGDKPAWLLVQCDGGTSSGFDIWAVNPAYTGIASTSPDQPSLTNPPANNGPTYNPTFVAPTLPNWVSWIFTGTGLLVIGGILFSLFLALIGLVLWAWSTIAVWKHHGWVFGVAALVSGFFFPIVAPIIWLIVDPILNRPSTVPMAS